MNKLYYHATSEKCFNSIMKDKKLKCGIDGIVYLADSKENALKFVVLRIIGEPIFLFEIELDDNEVEETFDHSYNFFKCKSYGINRDINLDEMISAWRID